MVGPKQFLLGGVAAFAFAGAAFAADVPVRGPVYTKAPQAWSWDGTYIGAHAGYGWAKSDSNQINVALNQFEPSGGLFGLQFGYNRHIARNWLLGYEIDVSIPSGFTDAANLPVFGPATYKIDLFGTARTRLGYVQGPWMIYATGGLAWATTSFDMPNAGAPTLFNNRPHIGYAAGVGAEYAFARNWSAKLEYLYADLGKTDHAAGGNSSRQDLTLSTVRFGLNYRFAGLGEAPVAAAFPVKAPVRLAGWGGTYLGLHAGYAWGSYDYNDIGTLVPFELKGGLIGFQSGYNWMLSRNWLVGVEADSSWASIKDRVGANTAEIDAMGTVRARLGYATDRTLLYVTGGLAWAHTDERYDPLANNSFNDMFHLGWTAGVGVEYAFAPRWSAKLEYLYADYGSRTEFNLNNTSSWSMTTSTVKLGVNYRASLLELFTGR